jgi:hypothetical protein
MEPTDKSMPPVIITKVIPTATIPLMEVCLNMFRRFPDLKKGGDITAITAHNIKKAR